MKSRLPAFAIIVAAVGVAGCAGRAPQLVDVVQAKDKAMDCTAILAEVQSNNAKVQELAGEQGMKVAQNVVAGVAGLVVPILWFGMDFQGTATKEIQALQARQQYLASLAEQRNCGAAPAPVVASPPKAGRS